jgi:hypothetical protein
MSIFPKLLKFRIELMFIKVNFSKFFLIIKVFSLIIELSLFVMISPELLFPMFLIIVCQLTYRKSWKQSKVRIILFLTKCNNSFMNSLSVIL